MGLPEVSDQQSSRDTDITSTFSCPICFDTCPRSEVFVPSGCTHEFCRECARGMVLSAVRNLDFPIDCPLCKIATADSEGEEEGSSEPSADEHPSLTAADRTHSERLISHMDAVDPNHAMQLHASHSTPSLETSAVSEHSSPNVAGSSRHDTAPPASIQQRRNGAKASGAKEVQNLAPVIDICANTAEIGFPPVVTSPESEQSRSSQLHVTSPSFPIIVTGTPNTPSLVPTDPLPNQGSHTLFSPHQLSHRPELHSHSTEVSQTSNLGLSNVGLSATQDKVEAAEIQTQADLAGRDMSLSDQMTLGSISLGEVMAAPRGVTRGLNSPADWVTAVNASVSRSSSAASPPLSRRGSRGGPPQGRHSRRGSLDADVHMLLTHEEEEEYLSKSLKAAAHRYGSLVQCPKPDCEGVASLQEGDPHFECPQCSYEWCRECQRDWHPATRCQDATGEKCVSRYIPKKEPVKKKGHRRGGSGCMSMGSVGDLIKGTMKKKFGSMDVLDADVSLNRYLKRNRVLECPQCKNGITKMDGGCNHIMCAVCKTHICWLCGVKICQGINNYWDANRHFWIKGTPCYGQIQAEAK